MRWLTFKLDVCWKSSNDYSSLVTRVVSFWLQGGSGVVLIDIHRPDLVHVFPAEFNQAWIQQGGLALSLAPASQKYYLTWIQLSHFKCNKVDSHSHLHLLLRSTTSLCYSEIVFWLSLNTTRWTDTLTSTCFLRSTISLCTTSIAICLENPHSHQIQPYLSKTSCAPRLARSDRGENWFPRSSCLSSGDQWPHSVTTSTNPCVATLTNPCNKWGKSMHQF